MKDISIIIGTSNEPLGHQICKELKVEPIKTMLNCFGNGERQVEIKDSVRNTDVFVIQSSSNESTNDHLMELFLLLDALKRSSCYRVTVVMPNFPYARQDRKVKSRVPISAKVIANLLHVSGADRLLTAELHSPQIAGFFDIPVDNLYMGHVFLPFIKNRYKNNNLCVVAPDAGSVKVAKRYAGRLGCDVAMIYKNRSAPGKIKEMNLIGEVKGKHCIIIDDMVDSAGTLCKACNLIISNKALSVEAYCTHAIFSGKAEYNISLSELNKIFVTDTIENSFAKMSSRVEILPTAFLFAEAIKGIHEEKSLSYLFDI